MTPAALVKLLAENGIILRVSNGHLIFTGPRGAYDELFRREVWNLKNELLEDWRCMSCEVIADTFYGLPPERLCLACHRREHPRAPGPWSYLAAGEPPLR